MSIPARGPEAREDAETREIALATTDAEIAACFPVMRELRTHLATEAEFVARVRAQIGEGFMLAALRDETGRVAACAGFRVYSNLFCGRHLYVDDLVTLATDRSKGRGRALLRWLRERAVRDGCEMLILDSGVQRFGAHRFYLREGFDIIGHHFAMKLSR